MHPNNFVIDVNIYVSYIIKSKLDELFTFVLERDLEVFISNRLITELSEVLSRNKFKKYLQIPPNEFVKVVVQLATPLNHQQKS
jgi:putative PIN family toxin of toxin-antitoxin system